MLIGEASLHFSTTVKSLSFHFELSAWKSFGLNREFPIPLKEVHLYARHVSHITRIFRMGKMRINPSNSI